MRCFSAFMTTVLRVLGAEEDAFVSESFSVTAAPTQCAFGSPIQIPRLDLYGR